MARWRRRCPHPSRVGPDRSAPEVRSVPWIPPRFPSAPRNLEAVGGDEQVTLSWKAPVKDGGAAITDYEYRINQTGEWISIGFHGHHPYGYRPRQRHHLRLPGAGGQRGSAGASLRTRWRQRRGCRGGFGFCAFRQWGGHHLRPRTRECVHPSDPARDLLSTTPRAISDCNAVWVVGRDWAIWRSRRTAG